MNGLGKESLKYQSTKLRPIKEEKDLINKNKSKFGNYRKLQRFKQIISDT